MVISQKTANGFSLVELVIVILITGIMAAVAAPKYFDSVCDYRVKLASERIISDLEMAAEYAKSTNSDVTIDLDSNNSSYTINQVGDRNGSNNAYQVNFSEPPYEVRAELSVLISDSIRFDKFGRQDQQLRVTLQDGGRGIYMIYDSYLRQYVELSN